jgi:DNA-binding XRE family transcriptional regulator
MTTDNWEGQRLRNLRESLPPRVREVRVRLHSHPKYLTGGLTQQELANRLGTTSRSVARWESGATRIRDRRILARLKRMERK